MTYGGYQSRSNNTIAAIPITYNGVRFRSRLEARWSKVFDVLELEWLYEPQDFWTPYGRYLPDFFLSDLNLWWEVKGAAPTQAAINAAHAVAVQTRCCMVMSWGDIPSMQVGNLGLLHWGGADGGRSELVQCTECAHITVRTFEGQHTADPEPGHSYSPDHPLLLEALRRGRELEWEKGGEW